MTSVLNQARSQFMMNRPLTADQQGALKTYFRNMYARGNGMQLSAKERKYLMLHLTINNRASIIEALSKSNKSNAITANNLSFLIKTKPKNNKAPPLTAEELKAIRNNMAIAAYRRAPFKVKERFGGLLQKRYGTNVKNNILAQRAVRKAFKAIANEIVRYINESAKYLRQDKYKESFKSISKAKDLLDKSKKDFNKEISPYLKVVYNLTSVPMIRNAITNRNTKNRSNGRNAKGILGGNSPNAARSKIRRSMFGGYTLAVIPKVREMDIKILTYKNYAERLKTIAARLKINVNKSAPKPPPVAKPTAAPTSPAVSVAPKGPGFVNRMRKTYTNYKNAKKQKNLNAKLREAKRIKNLMNQMKGNIGEKGNKFNSGYNNNQPPPSNGNRSPEITPAA